MVLFGPKVLGLVALLGDRPERRRAGGTLRVLFSFVFEVIVSALIAPIMMLIQTGVIVSIAVGADAGWKPQRREDGHVPLAGLIRRHRWHVASGLVLACGAYAVSPAMLAWLSPAIAGLVLSVPVSSLTASPAVGRFVKWTGLLRTPEEADKPPVEQAADLARAVYRDSLAKLPGFVEHLADDRRRRMHLALIDRPRYRARGKIDAVEALAAVKIDEAGSLEEAVSFLAPDEQAITLATPALFERLGRLAGQSRSAA